MIPELKIKYVDMIGQYLAHMSVASIFEDTGIRSMSELMELKAVDAMLRSTEIYTLLDLNTIRWISKNKNGKITIQTGDKTVLSYNCEDFPRIKES